MAAPTNCRSCGAPIIWQTGTQGPLEARRVQVYVQDLGWIHGHESHFAYCKQAKAWRGEEKTPTEAGPPVDSKE